MSDHTHTPQTNDWGLNLEAAICEHCDWRYLLPIGILPLHCPHCFQQVLTALNSETTPSANSHPPELLLPFSASTTALEQTIKDFAGDIWFAPGDLNPQNLKDRLQRIYLPMWLVDRTVQATWQAEAGFDYEIVSHRDSFDEQAGGWKSQQVTEKRTRWEPRLGRLLRTYDNLPAPALEEHHQLLRRVGRYDLDRGQTYQPQMLQQALIRLPNRPPDDAWPDAEPGLQVAAAEECQQAAQADHIRDFRWTPAYLDQNWTLLLLPLYVTYYLDDDRNPQSVLIHGQSGQLSAPRRASMRRAQRTALTIAGIGAVIFTLSLLIALASFLLPPLLLVAALGVILALIVGGAAIVPVVIVWRTNR